MVNFSNMHAVQNFAKKDTDINRQEIEIYKQKYCGVLFQPKEALLSGPVENQPSDLPAKPSPSYMDVVEDRFNFPNHQLQNGSRFHSHVMVENLQQSAPPMQPETHPILSRQISLNTVMDVIENHVIEDNTSRGFTATNAPTYTPTDSYNFMSTNTPQMAPTNSPSQPINIQQPASSSNTENFNSSQGLQFSNFESGVTVLAPPLSDMRDRMSSISSSPGGISFTHYQEDFPQPQHLSSVSEAQEIHQYQNDYTPENFTYNSLPPTEDQPSPYQPVFSPYLNGVGSPVETNNNNQTVEDRNVFSFSNQPVQCEPSQSPVNCNYSPQPQFFPQTGSSPAYPLPIATPQNKCHPSPPPYHEVMTTDVAGTNTSVAFTEVAQQFQLEEIDHTFPPEEVGMTSFSPTTELEKADKRRIRNNLACRASRERRKKRKAEKEAHKESLENENRQLRETIRQLEEQVKVYQEKVRRRMEQNRP